MKIIQTHNPDYQSEISALYIEAFSGAPSNQYIDPVKLDAYIKMILEKGYALLAILNGQVVGAVLSFPLKFDNLLPDEIKQNFDTDKCIYVAELMVGAPTRGQGIGNKLMMEFFKTVDKSHYTDAFIRVWEENIPALNLYRKMNFVPVTSVEQTKKKADGSGTFVMKKIYLHKKLD